jgi:hypothetical protein
MTGADTIFDQALDDIFSALGVDVAYNGATIHGYFKSPSNIINTETGELEEAGPGVEVRTSDVPDIAHGAGITIAGTAYKVTRIFTDGKGTTILELATT